MNTTLRYGKENVVMKIKRINPVAKVLRSDPRFKSRVIPNKKKEEQKVRNKKRGQDYERI